MQDLHTPDQGSGQGRDFYGVSHFASQVVSILADRTLRDTPTPRSSVIESLVRASRLGAPDAFADLLVEVRKARITLAALADVYIPLAARQMGEDWHEDRMSWMDVSIGVGRLQALLREIGHAWMADQAQDAGHGTVLLLVPEKEQHTLGPMVAMGQIRRYGISVCLRIAPPLDELRSLIVARNFDGVMISVGTEEKLNAVTRLIKFIRSVAPKPLPVVLGGAIMQHAAEAASCTGADLFTPDIGSALEVMGLKLEAQGVLKRA